MAATRTGRATAGLPRSAKSSATNVGGALCRSAAGELASSGQQRPVDGDLPGDQGEEARSTAHRRRNERPTAPEQGGEFRGGRSDRYSARPGGFGAGGPPIGEDAVRQGTTGARLGERLARAGSPEWSCPESPAAGCFSSAETVRQVSGTDSRITLRPSAPHTFFTLNGFRSRLTVRPGHLPGCPGPRSAGPRR